MKPIAHISTITDRHDLRVTVKEALDKAGLKAEGLAWCEATMQASRREMFEFAADYVEVR